MVWSFSPQISISLSRTGTRTLSQIYIYTKQRKFHEEEVLRSGQNIDLAIITGNICFKVSRVQNKFISVK